MSTLKSIIKFFIAIYGAYKFNRFIKSGQANGKLLILMYHRVLPKHDPRLENEEPGMYVTPDTLSVHLNELSKCTELIHIEEWQELAKQGKLKDTLYCAITFDDGWADNYEFAFPILKEQQAPATIFLATDYIDSNTTFWPERLANLLNNSEEYQKPLTEFFNKLGEDIDFKRLNTTTSKQIKDYISSLIQAAKRLTEEEIKSWLSKVELTEITQTREMLTWAEIKEMHSSNIRIGGHTRSHLRLNDKANTQQIQEEVEGCASDIKNQLGLTPTQFCYPNGDVSPTAERIVGNNFNIAVTTQRGVNSNKDDALNLKRVGVHEDSTSSSTKFLAVLSKVFQ